MDKTKFSKQHLRNPKNRKDLAEFHKDVLRSYSNLIKDALAKDYDFAVKFLLWLKQYYELFMNEDTFKPTFLPAYERGQIILLNLGFRIGHELGGPHYGIVLDVDNRKKSGLITVVPFISKKQKHIDNGLKPWEYELPFPVSKLIMNKAVKLSTELADSGVLSKMVDLIEKSGGDLSTLRKPEYKKLEKEFTDLYTLNIEPLLAMSPKFKKGSIVDTQQILTVSKQRIITPTRRNDALFNVKIPEETLKEIDAIIIKNYIGNSAETLDKTC